MKTLFAATMLAAGTLLSSSALAQAYLGGSVGYSKWNSDCTGLSSCDNNDVGFKVYGGYMFVPQFGLEAAYVDLGKTTGSLNQSGISANANIKSNGFALFAVGALPIENFSLFAKLGFSVLNTKANATASGDGGSASISSSNNSTQFAWGLGAGYNFTKQFGARLEWEQYKPEVDGEKGTTNLFSLGLQYTF